jgi:hypothetical protein
MIAALLLLPLPGAALKLYSFSGENCLTTAEVFSLALAKSLI